MSAAPLSNPGIQDRVAVMGATGTGKTQRMLHLLSRAYFTEQPYIIFNYKQDDLLNSIERRRELSLSDKVPTAPGIYSIAPHPDDDDAVNAWLWKLWERGNTGVVFDEGYMAPWRGSKGAFPALLTQGRSKQIPMFVGTQRPAWISRFVFTEAQFYSIFRLQHRDDKGKIQEFIPEETDLRKVNLPEYCSLWYDVKRNSMFKLAPVPDAAEILDDIDFRLRPKRNVI